MWHKKFTVHYNTDDKLKMLYTSSHLSYFLCYIFHHFILLAPMPHTTILPTPTGLAMYYQESITFYSTGGKKHQECLT